MVEIDNLVLENLPLIRGQLNRVETRLDDLTLCVGHIERGVTEHSVQLAELKFDRLDARVTRIEKRLELVET